MKSLNWRHVAIVGGVFGLAFALGFAFNALKFFPYNQLKGLAAAVMGSSRAANADEADPGRGDLLNRQYVRDAKHLSLDRQVDSILLPLKLEGMRVSETYAFPKGGGAITSLGDTVIVLDRLGNLYASRDGGSIEKLAFPALPNHIQEYIASPKFAGLSSDNFRAHRVLFIPSLHALAVSHSDFDASKGATRIAVSLVGIDEGTLKPAGAWKTVFVSDPQPYGPHEGSGGAMALRGESTLELALGDQVTKESAPAAAWSTIVEIELPTGKNHVVSVGHRNTTGMAVLDNGQLMSVEMGPRGGDELNAIREGGNYGYPSASLGSGYENYRSGSVVASSKQARGSHAGFAQPVFAWLPSVAVSDIWQIKRFDKSWNGDLLVSSLKGLSVFRLRMVDGSVQYSEPVFIGQRIRDVTELENGAIALWTDDAQLLFLSVDKEKLASGKRFEGQDNEAMNEHCLNCHHFGPTNPSDFAPTLSGLFDRRIASDDFRYSAGLRDNDGAWSESSLRAFLSDPGKFAPGTSMPNRNLRPDELDDIMQVLKDE